MSKQSNNKISVAEIIQLLRTAPEQGYEQLILSGHYFYTKQTDNFWVAYMQSKPDELKTQYPESTSTFEKIGYLALFYMVRRHYEARKVEFIQNVVLLNPDETSLLKSLFLCLELGSESLPSQNYPSYSTDSLEAVKILLREISPKLQKENQSTYSVELAQLSMNLILTQVDLALLKDFLDAMLWADFEIQGNENLKGFDLRISNEKDKDDNLFILNRFKTSVKRRFQKRESQSMISEQEHFKKNDLMWKTNEGLLMFIHNSNSLVVSNTPGTTSLKIEDDSIWEDITSVNPIKRNIAVVKWLKIHLEQNFHYQLRHALSETYEPNEEIDIHALTLEIREGIVVTIFDLLSVMSCFIAQADIFRYLGEFPNASIRTAKMSYMSYLESQNPELTPEQLDSESNNHLFQSFTEIDEKIGLGIVSFFTFVEHHVILSWLDKIEELKTKTREELEAIIELFVSLESPLPFNPLYKVEERYYFSYISCKRDFNINRLLYDYYISDKLFNSNAKQRKERLLVGEKQQGREVRFTQSLKELFKTLTPFAEAGLKYDPKLVYDFSDLQGEFDVIAYFERENIIIPIQVKLSNVSPRTEKRKKEWVSNHIETKGIEQVAKDIKLLQTESGLKFIKDKLKIDTEIKEPTIYPLIVTDNFFADHGSFVYNEQNDSVRCVSYFELKHLLLNEKVHDKQIFPLNFNPKDIDIASKLIGAIEQNTFWGFLSEFTDNFKLNKSLSSINDEFKIRMIV